MVVAVLVLFWDEDVIKVWRYRWLEQFWLCGILLSTFVMAMELVFIKLFAVAVTVFYMIILY